MQSAIASYEAVADVINARKDKSRLYLSKYVEDALQTAANSDGDLEIARQVKDVAAVHSTIWPEEPQRGGGVLPPSSVYSRQTVMRFTRAKPTQTHLKNRNAAARPFGQLNGDELWPTA